MNAQQYPKVKPLSLKERKWPSRCLSEAPTWCSVDLRDANQALDHPMTLTQKAELFNQLCDIGFKEIEVSFPSASQTDFNFTRYLIDNEVIPEDVWIQVMCPSQDALIDRTFESIAGAKRAILHFFMSASPLQRELVLKRDVAACERLSVEAAKRIMAHIHVHEKAYPGSQIHVLYSLESFSSTEPDIALALIDAVAEVLIEENQDPTRRLMMNLCHTVERSMPNYYADLVEYMIENSRFREQLIWSIHTHNDRGTAVAANELALLAGANRVEGTLFGTGERAGNADLVTLALNFLTQGIDPKLDLSHLPELMRCVKNVMNYQVPSKHPYGGSDIFKTYSGTHQDAIRKVLKRRQEQRAKGEKLDIWHVPYLPVDPGDLGFEEQPIIRITSQSGRSGIHYIMETLFGYDLPAPLLAIFARQVKAEADRLSRELSYEELYTIFSTRYLNYEDPLRLIHYSEHMINEDLISIEAKLLYKGHLYEIQGQGKGVLTAFAKALTRQFDLEMELMSYQQNIMEDHLNSRVVTYLGLKDLRNAGALIYFGVGTSNDLTKASLRASLSALNHYLKSQNLKNQA